MIERLTTRAVLLILSLYLAVPLCSAEPLSRPATD